MSIWYKLSLASGLIPLTTGCLIFFSWLVIRADWLMLAGIYNIMAGLALFVCGLGFLLVYGQKERKSGNRYPLKRTLISLGILLFNFPAAALALYSAEYIITTSTATVINNSSFEVIDMVLIEREQSYPFPPIAPGQEVIEHFHFKYEGSVDYKLSLNGSVKTGVMFGYVTGGMGDNATMVINSEGAVEIGR
ncbi:MAG: hypothetical protein GY775_13600 [Candidatus Scalindua sp.]|nr:hypothetical protein [Candidatus Scalindua sp.]